MSDTGATALSGAAIITGAGGGIGAAIAARLATEDLALVLADRDAASLDRVVRSLPVGTRCEAVVGDVADPTHHDQLVSAAEDLGGLSISVLNAGVYLPGLSWELPLEQWELHVRVNYWGVVHGVRAAVPAMIARGGGHVVGMASGAGLVATPALAPYVSTKHAVVGLMESLHHELARVAPEVHASVVCPGNVATPMASNSLAAAGIDDEHLSGTAAAVAAAVRAGNDAGQDPSTVADAIVAAVRDHRFWVLPQPEIAWAASDRVRRLADGEPPVDLLG